MSNREQFKTTLAEQYKDLLLNDPEYLYVAQRISAESLAERMTTGLASARITTSKDGTGVQRTCKILKIKYTYKAIREFLNA